MTHPAGNVTRIKRKSKSPSKFSRRIIIALSLLVALTITTVVWQFYKISPNSIDSSNDELIEKLNNDLELATQPFSGQHFNLDQIFRTKPVWGTLNSGHYFSLKLSSPNSIETSFLWFKNQLNNDGRLNVRHLCDQNDNLNFYAWIRHDFHTFGEQIIEDEELKFRTTFLKGDLYDQNWEAKVELESTTAESKSLSIIQYVTIDRPEDELVMKTEFSRRQPATSGEPFIVEGKSEDVGNFKMEISFDGQRDSLIHESYLSGYVDKNSYPISSYLQSQMMISTNNNSRIFILPGRARNRQNQEKRHNIIAYQMIVRAPASFTMSFSGSKSDSKSATSKLSYDTRLKQKIESFDAQFEKTFPIKKFTFTGNMTSASIKKLAKISLSNMIGGIGYFYGYSFIGANAGTKIARYGPIQLLTGVPSRSFFPRGFLWDEAFHNLLISKWDPGLSNAIIESWFNIMNVNGWIPREVILGVESMRKVPHEFIVQRISNANPPAMFIVLEKMLDDGLLQDSTLETIYPRLKTWYSWFNITQSGKKPGTFRWRGRDELSVNMLNPKTLTSGLDDYPRASHPSPDEYHVDLLCWMALAARTLAKLAAKQGDISFQQLIASEAVRLSDNTVIDGLHWSEEHKMYCDFGHNTRNVELVRVTKTRKSSWDSSQVETYEALERRTSGPPTFGCIPEFGYVSLFPMLLRVLDQRSEKLGIILDKLGSSEELWSDFGIRSLSKLSRYYNKYNTEHDKPYWRGPIWFNLNYLILSSLKHYSNLDGPYQTRSGDLLNRLKQNLIQNIDHELQRTKYIWEHYNDLTGFGQGSHPFTGWSALVLLVMSDY